MPGLDEIQEKKRREWEKTLAEVVTKLTVKKREEGLSELEEQILQLHLDVDEFEKAEVEDKIKAEIKKSLDAGEEYFEKPEETEEEKNV